MNEISLPDADATRQLGFDIGCLLQAGDIVTLSGSLGAGKTTFAQGLAKALQIESPVSSPTFVLMNEYEGEIALLHLDAYRLEGLDYDALRDAGVEDFLGRADAVRLIEWPEMIEAWLPNVRFRIALDIEDEGRRAVIVGS